MGTEIIFIILQNLIPNLKKYFDKIKITLFWKILQKLDRNLFKWVYLAHKKLEN